MKKLYLRLWLLFVPLFEALIITLLMLFNFNFYSSPLFFFIILFVLLLQIIMPIVYYYKINKNLIISKIESQSNSILLLLTVTSTCFGIIQLIGWQPKVNFIYTVTFIIIIILIFGVLTTQYKMFFKLATLFSMFLICLTVYNISPTTNSKYYKDVIHSIDLTNDVTVKTETLNVLRNDKYFSQAYGKDLFILVKELIAANQKEISNIDLDDTTIDDVRPSISISAPELNQGFLNYSVTYTIHYNDNVNLNNINFDSGYIKMNGFTAKVEYENIANRSTYLKLYDIKGNSGKKSVNILAGAAADSQGNLTLQTPDTIQFDYLSYYDKIPIWIMWSTMFIVSIRVYLLTKKKKQI